MKTKKQEKLIIAGPCAAENYQQVVRSAEELKKIGIKAFRASLWKPRTKPGFEGVGSQKAIGWLEKVIQKGLMVATEVLLPTQAKELVKKLVRKYPQAKFIFWLGARNQNHFIQRGIAQVLKKEKSVYLMIKNQIWPDEKHWLGIYEHVLSAGFAKERILFCHRGFNPNSHNPLNLRNIPDYKMAMRIKQITQRPMLLDPSHIGGESNKVLMIIQESLKYAFDGYLIEVHPDPNQALTDAKQQLNLVQLTKIMKQLKKHAN